MNKAVLTNKLLLNLSHPLVKIEHAKKYAPLIPNASTLYIDGMGHDLLGIYREKIRSSILETIL